MKCSSKTKEPILQKKKNDPSIISCVNTITLNCPVGWFEDRVALLADLIEIYISALLRIQRVFKLGHWVWMRCKQPLAVIWFFPPCFKRYEHPVATDLASLLSPASDNPRPLSDYQLIRHIGTEAELLEVYPLDLGQEAATKPTYIVRPWINEDVLTEVYSYLGTFLIDCPIMTINSFDHLSNAVTDAFEAWLWSLLLRQYQSSQ